MPKLRASFMWFCFPLSEDVHTSVIDHAIFPSPVRRCSNFGHQSYDFSFPCPKMLKLRSSIICFCFPLSEDAPTSDIDHPILPSPVRRYSNFGHQSCDFTFPCPKMFKLRSSIMRFCLPLSEDAQTSDIDHLFLLSSEQR